MKKYKINSKKEILENINNFIKEFDVDLEEYTQDDIDTVENNGGITLTYPCVLVINYLEEYYLAWEIVTKEDF